MESPLAGGKILSIAHAPADKGIPIARVSGVTFFPKKTSPIVDHEIIETLQRSSFAVRDVRQRLGTLSPEKK